MENEKCRRTKISPKSGRGLGHVTSTIFGSTVGYPSDSLASCFYSLSNHNRMLPVLAATTVIILIKKLGTVKS